MADAGPVEALREREGAVEVPAQAEGMEGFGPQLEPVRRCRVGGRGELGGDEIQIRLEAAHRLVVERSTGEDEGLGADCRREVEQPVEVLSPDGRGFGLQWHVQIPDVPVHGPHLQTARGHVGRNAGDTRAVESERHVVAHSISSKPRPEIVASAVGRSCWRKLMEEQPSREWNIVVAFRWG
jgi:hypothetical protein